MAEGKNSIDSSIEECKSTIKNHRGQALSFLGFMIAIPTFGGIFYWKHALDLESLVANTKEPISAPNIEIEYIIYLVLIVVFGVFTSLYRFHLKEIAKYEHFLIGFMRIRIAANNEGEGFQTEVRNSLTKDAFMYDTRNTLLAKKKGIENPMPGNPSADVATAVINKILDSIEIVQKKK